MLIINGSEAHVPPCMDIAKALRSHFNDDALSRMPGDLRSQSLYVAEDDDGVVVGFLSVVKASPQVAEITWMGVRPDLHGRGIGTAMMSMAVDDLVEDGFHSLRVRTLADTVDYEPYEGTRAFYRSRGFHLEEVIDPYPGWGPGNPCAVYVKTLR
jgi:ribosomal protein S18 acetylase RimI-like enzyme